MKIHHLNCGCMCPVGGALYDGFSKGLTARLACHCLLIEAPHGLVLVDTGFGLRDMEQPYHRLSTFFILLNRIQFDRGLTALEQIKRLGFKASDVRDIILTHLDFDHAGGLDDFPAATVHLLQKEKEAAQHKRGFIGSRRYRRQWDNIRHWQFYTPKGETWNGFEAVRQLRDLPPEILFIPLAGHTPGHAGVAIQTGDGWLFNAGDAYFYRGEIGHENRHCPPGTRLYQWMMETNRKQRLHNQERLRGLSLTHSKVRIFCSHDIVEFRSFAGQSTAVQAAP